MRVATVICICLILNIFFISCEKNDNKTDLVKLSGTVYQQGKSQASVKVSLNGVDNIETNTNNDGYFEFTEISKGDYVLKLENSNLSQTPNEVFVEKSINLSITENTNLNEITLPKPVTLFVDINDSKENAVLSWDKTDAEDFREYKLYRHNTSGLDESTGTLIHVSTSISDTSFNEDYDDHSIADYYYRVYVMNEYGRLGGSNIIHVNTEQTYPLSSYKLNLTKNIGVPISNPQGIASDQSNLWILGSEHNSSNTRLVYYNLTTFEIIKEFTLVNLIENLGNGVYGITWDGSSIWISVSGNTNKIVKVDPNDGAILKTWGSPTVLGPSDLDWDGENLWIASGTGEIFRFNTINGGTEKIINHINRDKGIAIRGDEVWVGDLFDKNIHIYNKLDGNYLGHIKDALINRGALCFHTNELAVLSESGIKFYEIVNNNE